MQVQNDPNVIYGGDADEFGPLNGGCASIGELIWSNLKKGGNKTAFVSKLNQSGTISKVYIIRVQYSVSGKRLD